MIYKQTVTHQVSLPEGWGVVEAERFDEDVGRLLDSIKRYNTDMNIKIDNCKISLTMDILQNNGIL